MKLLTLLAVLSFTTGTWAYLRDCAKGPEYWCRDATTAKKCGAVRHCEENVWNKKEKTVPSMTISETTDMLCNVLVQASTKLLTDGSFNRDSIKPYLRNDCTKLPKENNLIEQCEMAVDRYLSDIVRHIEARTESTKICSIIKEKETTSNFVPKPQIGDLTSNATCILCEFILHVVESMATANSSEKELVAIFEKVCSEMPSVLHDECKQFVDTYGADIIALLVREIDPAKVCELIKICPKPKDVAFLTKPNLQTCGLCDYISTYLKAGYSIENVCAHFSTENGVQEQCETLVHIYKPEMCSQLPLCLTVEQPQAVEPTVNSVECSLCKYIVGYVDTIIQNNKSEAAIEAALEKVCTILPHSLNASCVQFIENYGPILVQLLEKYTTPEQVCDALQLCHNATEQIPSFGGVKVSDLTVNSPQCTLCEFVLTYIEKQIGNNRSAAAIEAALDKVCNILPTPVKDNCTSFVNKFGPIIAILLAKNSTPTEVCDFLKVCNNGTQIVSSDKLVPTFNVKEPKVNSVQCSLCKYIVTFVDNYIGNNRSQAAVEAALEKVCTILPHSLNGSCVQFVVTFGPVLFQYIEKHGSPDLVCDALGLCHNGTEQIRSIGSVEPSELTVNSPQCTLCEFILTYIEKQIGNNRSAAAIEAALDKVCNILPTPVKDNSKNSTPAEVCDFLKVCNNGTQVEPSRDSVDMFNVKESKVNSVQCSLCKYIVTFVDNYIGNNRSQAAVEAALEKVCTILPHSLNGSCVQFVVTFGPVLFQYIEKHGSPDLVCDALGLCHNGTEQIRSFGSVEPSELTVNSPQCTLCEFILTYIEKQIGNNRSAAAIEAALDKVCNILPTPVKDNCTSFVNKFGPIIAILLAKNSTPAEVCDFLKVCNNGTQIETSPDSVDMFNVKESKVNSVQCSLCKYIVTFVDNYIGNNRSQAAVEAALEKVCTILPHSLNGSCVQFVVTFGPVLFQYIEKHGSPDLVCNALGLCHNGTEQIRSFGSVEPSEITVNSPQCTLCEFVLTYIEKQIGNNRSAAAIEAALDKVCNILPTPVKDNCTSFVNKFGPIIAILLAKNSTPTEVCDFLKVCNNGTQVETSRNSYAIMKSEERKVNSVQCSLCKYIVTFVDNYIQNNRSEAAVEAALEKVCEILPPALNGSCVQFVVTFGPVLFQYIEKHGSPDLVCNALGLCHNGTEQIRSFGDVQPLELTVNSPQCTLCEFILTYIEKQIGNNRSGAAIEAALDKVCNILPTPVKDNCTSFVNKFGPIIAILLAKNSTPAEVCDFLKVCNNGTQVETSPDSVDMFNVKESKVNSVQCSLCKYIVTFVDNYIQNNRSEAAVEAALEKVCEILPPALNGSCVQFVVTFGPVLFQYIEKHGSPDLVCNALGLCHNGTQEIPSPNNEDRIKSTVSTGASVECALCKYIVGYVDAVVQTNKSEAAIESALEKVCTVLPHTLNASCVEFIENFGPILVQLIEKYGRPDAVCNALQACHNGSLVTAAVQSEPVSVGSVECALCKFVVSYIDKIIQNNKSEAAIVDALEKVCSIVPKAVKDKCDEFVKTYGTELVQLIEKYSTPDEVCAALKICTDNKEKISQVVTEKSVDNPVECSICKYVVGYVDAVIQTNKSEAAVDAALEKVCTILPHSLNHTCYQFVDEYGPVLLELLVKYATPDQVCAALNLCHNGSFVDQKPVESKKKVNNDAECTLCKYVINYINLLLESNATEQEIAKGLEVVCTLLPSSDRPKCASFVQTYGPILPQLIAELDDPNIICVWLEFCPKSNDTSIQIPAIKHDKLNSLPCSLCQYLVNYLDAIIKSNSTETDFEKALERACKNLPGDKLQSECKIFVDLYAPDLINLLVEFGSPKTVCQELGICDK